MPAKISGVVRPVAALPSAVPAPLPGSAVTPLRSSVPISRHPAAAERPLALHAQSALARAIQARPIQNEPAPAAEARRGSIQRKPTALDLGNQMLWYDDENISLGTFPTRRELLEAMRHQPVKIFDITGGNLQTIFEISTLPLTITGLQIKRTDEGLKLTGDLSDGKDITGSVYLPEYYIDVTGKGAVYPVRANKVSFSEKFWYTRALRVHNINANPQGLKLGDYIAYYAAVEAEKVGIKYIVAMHVVPKARNFYLRLGFKEYDEALGYDVLVKKKEEIRKKLSTAKSEQMESLSKDQMKINEAMTEATLFVDTTTLKQNARKNWESVWKKKSPGSYEKK
jgi:hypothetical protein